MSHLEKLRTSEKELTDEVTFFPIELAAEKYGAGIPKLACNNMPF